MSLVISAITEVPNIDEAPLLWKLMLSGLLIGLPEERVILRVDDRKLGGAVLLSDTRRKLSVSALEVLSIRPTR